MVTVTVMDEPSYVVSISMTISYVGSGGSGPEIFFCVVLVNSGHGGNVNVLAGNSIGGVAMMFWREVGPAFGATTTTMTHCFSF